MTPGVGPPRLVLGPTTRKGHIMRVVTALALAFLLSPTPCAAQTLPEWYRVYTFDDSFIDMNTVWVFHDDDGVFRVTFRWSFTRPQDAGGDPRLKYKSRLE